MKRKRLTATISLDCLKKDEAGREVNSKEDDDEKKMAVKLITIKLK